MRIPPALRWSRGLALVVVLAAPVEAGILPDPQVTQFDSEEIAREIDRFEAVGDGIVLTLAICEEEPHCVTGMSEHELARLIDRIQMRINHLSEVQEEEGLDDTHARFLLRYRQLRDRYADYLRELRVVGEGIDPSQFEQAWEDLLDFGFASAEQEIDTGPDVPEPNASITLDRFQDAHKPMPID